MSKRAELMISYGILAAFSLAAVYPLFLALTVSLGKSTLLPNGLPWPTHFSLANYVRAWHAGDFAHAILGSMLVTAIVVPIAVILVTLAGYAFGTMQFRGSRLLFLVFLVGLVIPTEGTIIPLYWDLRNVGLGNTYASLILVQISRAMPFGIFWMRAFFLSVPRSVLEAATVDGASSFSTLWRVLLPAARPAIGTFVLLEFMDSFNDFLTPLILLQDPHRQTLQLAFLNFVGRRGLSDVTGYAAAGMMAALPVIIVFVIFQRQFARGLLGAAR